jgi:hypothetical protein
LSFRILMLLEVRNLNNAAIQISHPRLVKIRCGVEMKKYFFLYKTSERKLVPFNSFGENPK